MMRIICGDALRVLKKLPADSVDCSMSSPPYWMLRNYSVDGQLGLESTFDEYIQKLCDIYDGVKKVLKSTGVIFVNLGDTYTGANTGSRWNTGPHPPCDGGARKLDILADASIRKNVKKQLPEKSLCNIPARFSIEMQNRGWTLRQIIIWHKPNCMPASCTDRFTTDFEYVFMFTKAPHYFFEQQLEPADYDGRQDTMMKSGGKYADVSVVPGTSAQSFHAKGHERWQFGENGEALRNMRCVWRIPTQPFNEAHFATYPEELVLRTLKAGCPKQVCKKCGLPREAIWAGTSPSAFNIRVRDVKEGRIKFSDRVASEEEVCDYEEGVTHTGEGKKIVGYTDCKCGKGFRPGVVLDPFAGSGTTLKVAQDLKLDGIGIELNAEYIKLIKSRLGVPEGQVQLVATIQSECEADL